MTHDMQRWDMNHVQGEVYIDKNPEGSWVRFTDAEAAIAAAENAFRGAEQAWYRAGEAAGYERGKQDMLAKCIAAVEAQQMYASTVEEIMVGFDCAKREILRALRALQEMP